MTDKSIDALAAKARRQAAKLNQTLDALEALGVRAAVVPCPSFGILGGPAYQRVQLGLTDAPHKKSA